jgi:hypothetical protein
MDKKPKIDLAGWLKPRRKMEITESDGVMVVVITRPFEPAGLAGKRPVESGASGPRPAARQPIPARQVSASSDSTTGRLEAVSPAPARGPSGRPLSR